MENEEMKKVLDEINNMDINQLEQVKQETEELIRRIDNLIGGSKNEQ